MTTSKALTLSESAHRGQKYGDRDYFSYHVCGVVKNTESFLDHVEDYEEKQKYICVAYLHDVVEDTNFTIKDLSKHFDTDVIEAVDAITKPYNEKRYDYLRRVRKNKYAKTVKMADIVFNLSNCLMENNISRANYYSKQLKFMTEEEK